MLGRKSIHAAECFAGNFIGTDFQFSWDLTSDLTSDWKPFNKKYIPKYLEKEPEKSKVAAGLACAFLWTVSKGILKGDIVLCPNGDGEYLVGEVSSGYSFLANATLPHRRSVRWFSSTIKRSDMSEALQRSSGSIGTVSEISKFSDEIEKLLAGTRAPAIFSNDTSIEDPSVFAMEKHLEEFLIKNWKQTPLGKDYDIYEEEKGDLAGQQYLTDTGPVDILAIRKDNKELLVVELKKGRASDSVVGQIQRYMGYVQEEIAEPGQIVRGVIIALEDDLSIRRALLVTKNIEFYKYQVSFKLFKSAA